jgi:hypothetical protein
MTIPLGVQYAQNENFKLGSGVLGDLLSKAFQPDPETEAKLAQLRIDQAAKEAYGRSQDAAAALDAAKTQWEKEKYNRAVATGDARGLQQANQFAPGGAMPVPAPPVPYDTPPPNGNITLGAIGDPNTMPAVVQTPAQLKYNSIMKNEQFLPFAATSAEDYQGALGTGEGQRLIERGGPNDIRTAIPLMGKSLSAGVMYGNDPTFATQETIAANAKAQGEIAVNAAKLAAEGKATGGVPGYKGTPGDNLRYMPDAVNLLKDQKNAGVYIPPLVPGYYRAAYNAEYAKKPLVAVKTQDGRTGYYDPTVPPPDGTISPDAFDAAVAQHNAGLVPGAGAAAPARVGGAMPSVGAINKSPPSGAPPPAATPAVAAPPAAVSAVAPLTKAQSANALPAAPPLSAPPAAPLAPAPAATPVAPPTTPAAPAAPADQVTMPAAAAPPPGQDYKVPAGQEAAPTGEGLLGSKDITRSTIPLSALAGGFVPETGDLVRDTGKEPLPDDVQTVNVPGRPPFPVVTPANQRGNLAPDTRISNNYAFLSRVIPDLKYVDTVTPGRVPSQLAQAWAEAGKKGLTEAFFKTITDPATRRYMNAVNAILISVLRPESGAAINQDEFVRYANMFAMNPKGNQDDYNTARYRRMAWAKGLRQEISPSTAPRSWGVNLDNLIYDGTPLNLNYKPPDYGNMLATYRAQQGG